MTCDSPSSAPLEEKGTSIVEVCRPFLGLLFGTRPCRFEFLLLYAGWFTVWFTGKCGCKRPLLDGHAVASVSSKPQRPIVSTSSSCFKPTPQSLQGGELSLLPRQCRRQAQPLPTPVPVTPCKQRTHVCTADWHSTAPPSPTNLVGSRIVQEGTDPFVGAEFLLELLQGCAKTNSKKRWHQRSPCSPPSACSMRCRTIKSSTHERRDGVGIGHLAHSSKRRIPIDKIKCANAVHRSHVVGGWEKIGWKAGRLKKTDCAPTCRHL